MNTKDAYKQKIEAEMALLKAQLEVLNAKAKSLSADANLKYAKEITEMEDAYAAIKVKLHELGKANEETWKDLKADTQSAWDSLSENIKSAIAKLKK